jgi:hypothetical protein
MVEVQHTCAGDNGRAFVGGGEKWRHSRRFRRVPVPVGLRPIGGDAVGTLYLWNACDGFLTQSAYAVVDDFHLGVQAL